MRNKKEKIGPKLRAALGEHKEILILTETTDAYIITRSIVSISKITTIRGLEVRDDLPEDRLRSLLNAKGRCAPTVVWLNALGNMYLIPLSGFKKILRVKKFLNEEKKKEEKKERKKAKKRRKNNKTRGRKGRGR